MAGHDSAAASGPPPPNVNAATIMVPTIWVLDALAIIVVGFRMLASIKVLRKVSLADYIMLSALVFGVGNTIAITISAHYGMGRHIMYIEPLNIIETMKWQTIAEPIGIMCPMLGRISFCIYLLKLVGTSKWQKWLLHACIWFGVFNNILCIILILVQCSKIQAIYDPRVEATCWPIDVQVNYGYFQGVANTLIDLALTGLPAYIVWKLQLPRNLKIGLSIVLGLSVFASVASIVKSVELKSLGNGGDITYNLYTFVIWYTVENVVVICAASVPCIRPLFVGRKQNTGYSYTMSPSYGSNPKSKGYVYHGSDKSRTAVESYGGITKETVITQTTTKNSNDSDLDLPRHAV